MWPDSCDLTGQECHILFWRLLVWEKQRAWQQAEGDIQKEAPGRGALRRLRRDSKTEGQHFRGNSAGAGGGGDELEEGTEPSNIGVLITFLRAGSTGQCTQLGKCKGTQV